VSRLCWGSAAVRPRYALTQNCAVVVEGLDAPAPRAVMRQESISMASSTTMARLLAWVNPDAPCKRSRQIDLRAGPPFTWI